MYRAPSGAPAHAVPTSYVAPEKETSPRPRPHRAKSVERHTPSGYPIGATAEQAQVHAAFHFAHTFRLDVGVATGGRGVQAANTVDRGPLERTGVEVYEPGGREHVLRGVQRWLLAAFAIRQPQLAEAHDLLREMHSLGEAPRGAAARIPRPLVTDAERRVRIVADAALQEQLIVQVDVGLREVAFDAAALLGIVRERAGGGVLQLERLRGEPDLPEG